MNAHAWDHEALIEDVEFMVATGERLEGAAARLGTNEKALEAALKRAGRKDLTTLLRENSRPRTFA